MISKIKKPVSILLSVIMVFSLFTIVPFAASAAVDAYETLDFTANYQTVEYSYYDEDEDEEVTDSDNMAKAFSGEHFSVTPAPYVVDEEGLNGLYCFEDSGWSFGSYEPQYNVTINALNGDTIKKLVVYRSFWDKDPVLTVNGTNIPYTQDGEVFTFNNVNASEAILGINPDMSDGKFAMDISKVDAYYSVADPEPAEPTIYDSDYHDVSELRAGDYIVVESDFTDNSGDYTVVLQGGTYIDAYEETPAQDISFSGSDAYAITYEDGYIFILDYDPGMPYYPYVDGEYGDAFYVVSVEGKTITLAGAKAPTAPAVDLFPQHSISLGGNIGVNFYIDSAAADFDSATTATVEFTWDGTYSKVVDLKTLATDENGYYKATVDVVAAQMAHEIHAVVYLNGEALDQTDDYSVQKYAETVYADPAAYDTKGKPDELKALVKALLNYGAMAQTVFDSALNEKPALANATVGENGYRDVTADQIAAAINGSASDLNDVATQLGAKYFTNSLIYLSKNTLRIYFTPTTYPGEIPNAGAYDGSLSNYYYYVDHENIPAAELDDQQTFNVNGTEFTFSALDYAKAVVDSGMTDDQKNLARTLYLYNQTANAYFDAAPAPVENIVDLSTLEGDYEAQDGDVLTGTLEGNKMITVADGATIALRDATITNLTASNYYAGITLLGDATVLLEGTNAVKGGYANYPGIYVPENKTLTINGDGSLDASSNGYGCGIGGGFFIAAGNIVINGGTVTATGGQCAAGIGGGYGGNCGDIIINGGAVTAFGGAYGAGIGSSTEGNCSAIKITGGTVNATGGSGTVGIGSGSYNSGCGNITIANTVTQVTAKGGNSSERSIGAGNLDSTCGTVTIGGEVYADGITDSPYTYQP